MAVADRGIPVMRTYGSGSIVNISSMAVRHAYPFVGYKTTKTAILGLTENLASMTGSYAVPFVEDVVEAALARLGYEAARCDG